MCNPNGTKLSLKVVINKQKSKVLFAEANSYVADVLLGFLTLPLGKIVRILVKHYGNTEAPVIGCLTTFCRSLYTSKPLRGDDEQHLYFGSMSLQDEFLNAIHDLANTHSSFCRPHSANKPNASESFKCCCNRALTTTDTTFIISDDLRLVPMGSTGFLQALDNLGISDIDGAETRSLSFRIDDVVDLLMLSLISSTPLTDLVFKNILISSIKPISHQPLSFKGELNNSAKMSLIVSLQKSTNKLLFAEAREEFVEFLFSVVTLPLGEAVRRLDGKTPFNNINNIYTSAADFIGGDEYFVDPDTKRRLINPNISRGYFSSDQIVKNHSKKQKMFTLNDDLTFAPFSMASIVLMLNDLHIPLSDVKEMELHIGEEEALMILEASLTSKTALTDALINPMLGRLPPQEVLQRRPRPIRGGGGSFVMKAEE